MTVVKSSLLELRLLILPDLPIKNSYNTHHGGYDVDDEGSQGNAKPPGEAAFKSLALPWEESSIVSVNAGKYTDTYS